MIKLRLKNLEELKRKAGGKNALLYCRFCATQNFSQPEIGELGKKLNAEVVGLPMLCAEPEIRLDAGRKYDTIFVLSEGAGVQAASEKLGRTCVPAADTMGLEVKSKNQAWCVACGDCNVDETWGFCVKSRCAKFLLNGPCGGVRGGLCEVGDFPCVWVQIYNKLKKEGMLGEFAETRMPKIKR